MLHVSPSMRYAIPHKGRVIQPCQVARHHPVAHTMLQIHNESFIPLLRICEAIECRSASCCDFRVDAEAFQHHLIISRAQCLPRIAIFRRNSFASQFHISLRRHQGNIAQVGTTRSTKVCLSKSHNRIAALMIARAPVPSALDLGRSCIHHAERHISSCEYMSVVSRTDARIYEICIVLG